jgi:magnesium transporter
MSVFEAFQTIRKVGVDKETIYTCYVTDHSKLIGVVTVKDMLLCDENKTIGEIMERNVIYVNTHDDKEETVNLLSKYDFMTMPVTDAEGRLVGIVTFDDAIDVIQEETTEDIEKMAAITPTDKPYLKLGVFATWKNRIPWLALLMVSATFTGTIISHFEESLAKVVVLTAFIPMLMDSGGNAGSQASVTIIRGLSLGEIRFGDIFRVVWKEFRVSLLCGVSLALLGFLKAMFVDRVSVTIALVIALTLFVTIVCAKLVGCVLPMLAKKLGFDPAVMASPFITTIVDAIGLVVYFKIATLLLDALK